MAPRVTKEGLEEAISSEDRAKREESATRKLLSNAKKQIAKLEQQNGLLSEIDSIEVAPAEWAQSARFGTTDHHAVANLLLSDLHLDEVVDPAQMRNMNAYDRDIALMRLKRLGEKTILLARDYVSGVTYDGIYVWVNGDIISGNIHEELERTNAGRGVTDTVDYWVDPLAGLLLHLADFFGKVHVVSTVGNHGRSYKKPPAKDAVRSSFDWLTMRIIHRCLRTDDRFTWNIPESTDVFEVVYNTRYLCQHGDDFKGGDQIAGPIRPVLFGDMRSLVREVDAPDGQPYDRMLVSHFHQYNVLGRGTLNGCFPAHVRVHTPTGPRVISEVTVGDSVLSRDGSWQAVTHRFERLAADGLVKLKVRGLPALFEATPNHEVWAIKGATQSRTEPKWYSEVAQSRDVDQPEWIPAGYLSPGDWVHVPAPDSVMEPFDVDVAWLYGLYLAEGHTLLDGGSTKVHQRIGLSMHREELAYLYRAAKILNRLTGRDARVTCPRGRKHSAELILSVSRETALDWRERFGHKSYGKRVPPAFHNLSCDLKTALLAGWTLGDGHIAYRRDGHIQRSAVTTSERLAWDMFHMSASVGQSPALSVLRAGGPRKRDSYTIAFNAGQETRAVDGETFYRVQHRFRSDLVVPVYDLEVSGEHTYVVEGVGVHNSVVGYNEYAKKIKARWEPPQQAFWIDTPENGPTMHMPVLCSNRSVEGW